MTAEQIAHPPIVSAAEWQAAREELLAREKALTRARDAVGAARRRLPMVKMDAGYRFVGRDGEVPFAALFEGRRQLIIYHFMYGPEWDAGCPTCTGYINSLSGMATLHDRDTTFAIVARAPYEKLAAWRERQGWTIPWYSSYGSSFNYDFHVSDERGEGQGLSVFFRLGDEVYHTYSTYQRGVEGLTSATPFLDITPYGRQEDWEDSPPGWPQRPTYG